MESLTALILAAMSNMFAASRPQQGLKPMGLHSQATPGWFKDSSQPPPPGWLTW